MLNPIVGSVVVLLALSLLFVWARAARRRELLSPEGSRKVVHVGMGLVCLTFPWLFPSVMPVLVLAAVAAAALWAIRQVPGLNAQFGCALHDVSRDSYGEFAFIAGVSSAFVLAHGNALQYVIPVAVLTFADAIAALIGTRFGTLRFGIFGGKTMEGSAAFFIMAIACVAMPLALSNMPVAIAATLSISAALMLVEALSRAGFDNFAIPVLGVMLLRAFGIGNGLGAM